MTSTSSTSSATYQNTDDNCSYRIGLATYKKYDNNIDNQEIYNYKHAIIGPNASLTLTVNVPPCAYQSDAFYGDVIFSFAGGVRYGSRLLDADQGAGAFCTVHCLTPTPTFGGPTSTPTKTPTAAPPTSTPTKTPTAIAPTSTPTPIASSCYTTIKRVSVATGGAQGNSHSGNSNTALSSDGRYVAFVSLASNLVSGDTNDDADIFVFDCQTGQTKRVSVATGGGQSNGDSALTAISGDGRYVAFFSTATNLVASDTNGKADAFVHDRNTNTTTRVSVGAGGAQGNGDSISGGISSDGRYVTFSSTATNLVSGDTNSDSDVFVHDRNTGTTTRVSVGPSAAQAIGDSYLPAISGDGRYVTYTSLATNLVSGDTNADSDVFVYDRNTGTTTRVSISTGSAQGNDHSGFSAISADGRYVTYASAATNLVSGDTNAKWDIFVRDRTAGTTTRVSVSSAAAQGNDDSAIPAISGDGRYVAYSSNATNLVSGDTNADSDVFVYDRNTGTTTRFSRSSGGTQGDNHSLLPGLSADGKVVAFTSLATNLVTGDTNASADVFAKSNP